MNERFSREVYLSAECMKDQLNMIGIGFGEAMQRAFPAECSQNDKYGRELVSSMFQRRNEIAHQNDRSHDDAVQNDITKAFVEEYIDKICKIVDAIQDVALTKEKEYLAKLNGQAQS